MKKLISVALAFCMALTLCTSAWAASLPAVGADGVIKLMGDVVLNGPYLVSDEQTIDLNGFKITANTSSFSSEEIECKDSMFVVARGGHLTIMDSVGGGMIDAGTASYNDGSEDYRINSAVKMTHSGELSDGAAAKLTVNGGTLKGYYYAVCGNGSRHNTEITINGGTLMGLNPADNLGIYHPQEGTLTINGGEIVGLSGLEMRAGTLIINGGTIKATGTYADPLPNGSGSTTTGAAVAIAQHTTKKNITVTISGGTLIGERSLNEANPQGNAAPVVQINVTDGTFNGVVAAVDTNAFAITGGQFDTDVTAFVPIGTPVAKDENGNHYVGSDSIADAANSGKDMTMVRGGAIDGLEPGAHIIVPQDVTGTTLNGDPAEWGDYTIADPNPNTYQHEPVRRQHTTTTVEDTAETETKADDTTKADTVTSAKTFDAGVAMYGVMAVASVLGMGYVGKKRV